MIKNDIGYIKSNMKTQKPDEGEFIETKVERIMANKEPITDGAKIIYTERKDGVLPEHNIRTDRFDMALDMTDTIAATKAAERAERQKTKNGETESTQGTEPAQKPA